MVFFHYSEGIFEIARQRAVGNAKVRTLYEQNPADFVRNTFELCPTNTAKIENRNSNFRQKTDKQTRACSMFDIFGRPGEYTPPEWRIKKRQNNIPTFSRMLECCFGNLKGNR